MTIFPKVKFVNRKRPAGHFEYYGHSKRCFIEISKTSPFKTYVLFHELVHYLICLIVFRNSDTFYIDGQLGIFSIWGDAKAEGIRVKKANDLWDKISKYTMTPYFSLIIYLSKKFKK